MIKITYEKADHPTLVENRQAPWLVSNGWKQTKFQATATPLQLRLAMIDADIDPDQIAASIEAMPQTTPEEIKAHKKAKQEWEYALDIDRHHPLVEQLITKLGKTSDEADQLFIAAQSY